MPAFNTIVVAGEPDVTQRLGDFNLVAESFISIGKVARAWADDASPLMPTNAPGTLAYIHGVQELRIQIIGNGWEIDRSCNVEAVINRELGIRIAFQNVDRACDEILPPIPRSAKGKGAEVLNGPDLFEHFGVEPGPLTGVKQDGLPTYYVMVGEDGSVELSHPIILNGSYEGFIERIFVHAPREDWERDIDPETGPVEDFDIEVSFKNEA